MYKRAWGVGALSAALAVAGLFAPRTAEACGGFFCSSTPVDQNAERVVFKVRPDGRTDMIVQISYQGKAEDFAWLLPLAEPPTKEDLGVFPQRALTALDAQTGVQIGARCFAAAADAGASAGGAEFTPRAAPVDVYVRTTIGNYDVAVIGSKDASATAEWLTTNGFRISDPMRGFVDLYTKEGMKFLALKLLPDKSANDITPFKLTLPGESPSIPLRLSAIASEPEMGVAVWIFGDQRYEPAGDVVELAIDNADLRLDPRTYTSNWLTLVARAADAVAGKGFVVEDAEPTASLQSLLAGSFASTPEQQEAAAALTSLFDGAPYLTRLYTRLSPEEMTFDPVFRRSQKGDVSRYRQADTADAGYSCQGAPTGEPCDFVACGALGLCRTVGTATPDAGADGTASSSAACACADGATARATFVPDGQGGFTTTVSCIDQRLSYLNPGDRNAAGDVLPDPCVGVTCGGHGSCVAMNMTATCACERGYVAQPVVDSTTGTRSASCVLPSQPIPGAFYNRRPGARDPSLPLGRPLEMEPPTAVSDPADPLPQNNADAMAAAPSSGGGGCSAGQRAGTGGSAALFGLLGVGLWLARSRRRAQRS